MNPCCLDADELPKIEDQDAEWRQSAVFLRDEIEVLLSDTRDPA